MIYVNSHGRMGNQYFQYAFAKNMQLEIYKKYRKWHDIGFIFNANGDLLNHTNAKYKNISTQHKLIFKIFLYLRAIEFKFIKNDYHIVKWGGD